MGSVDNGSLEHTVQVTHAWIDELDQHLGWHDEPRSYRLLMAVLHAVHEWLPVNETDDLPAHFPVRLCGRYCEERRSPTMAMKNHSTKDFIDRVALGFMPDPIKDPTAAILTVFSLLSEKVSESEIEDMVHVLPQELQRAWKGEDHRGCPVSVRTTSRQHPVS
jgi:uncharacterized protein (DUF2267 family)